MPVFSRQVGSCSVHYKLNTSWLPEHTSWNVQDIFQKYFHKCDLEIYGKENFQTNNLVTLLKRPLSKSLLTWVVSTSYVNEWCHCTISRRKLIQSFLDSNETEILYPLLLPSSSSIRKTHIFWKVFDNTQTNILVIGNGFVFLWS